MNILIVEDEQDIRELLEIHLSKEGYKIFTAEDGMQALDIFQNKDIDIALLDVMIPKIDGFNVLKKIRETSEIPVIFITAREEESDKILGLGLGADDYVIKPFSPIEIIARVKAQLRRYYKYSNKAHKTVTIVGELMLDKESCSIYKNNIELALNQRSIGYLGLF